MDNLNNNNAIAEEDFDNITYADPDQDQESIGDGDYYSDAYNFYPDAGF